MHSLEGSIHLQWSRVIILQDIYTKFGQMVRVARAKKGYTQLKLAERLHTTDRTVSKIERGQTNPGLDAVVTYARELDMSLDPLVRDTDSDRVPYCIANYFAGMEESLAMKYLKLCEAASLLLED